MKFGDLYYECKYGGLDGEPFSEDLYHSHVVWWIFGLDIPGYCKNFLLTLVGFLTTDNPFTAEVEELANDIGVSPDRVKRIHKEIKDLITQGVISRLRIIDGKTYEFDLEGVVEDLINRDCDIGPNIIKKETVFCYELIEYTPVGHGVLRGFVGVRITPGGFIVRGLRHIVIPEKGIEEIQPPSKFTNDKTRAISVFDYDTPLQYAEFERKVLKLVTDHLNNGVKENTSNDNKQTEQQ